MIDAENLPRERRRHVMPDFYASIGPWLQEWPQMSITATEGGYVLRVRPQTAMQIAQRNAR